MRLTSVRLSYAIRHAALQPCARRLAGAIFRAAVVILAIAAIAQLLDIQAAVAATGSGSSGLAPEMITIEAYGGLPAGTFASTADWISSSTAFVVLSIAFASMVVFNLAVWQHLRRVHLQPPANDKRPRRSSQR